MGLRREIAEVRHAWRKGRRDLNWPVIIGFPASAALVIYLLWSAL